MQKLEKWQLMDKIVRELDDLSNSQTAVLKKIGQIEADNINLNNTSLEKSLSEIYTKVSENLELVAALATTFREETEKFMADNKINELLNPTE
ncbi:hypothetical protein F0919_03390 [Taibaiella lutea]|uniref:Uncharacterized protein n=1 Tax=Taibaiella lutea TaxID=2608001 RepID=A0A5M6CNS5_9BACT|nr:hypothetical protein [Taibaiella lutea]KAA5536727.1 hypothetical protein F0919_03390 [Taibaiella lutea]